MDELIRAARVFVRVADEAHDFCDVAIADCFYCTGRAEFEQALAEAEDAACSH